MSDKNIEKAPDLPHFDEVSKNHLTLVPGTTVDPGDYPNLEAITQAHLHISQRYASRAHEATRLEEGDDKFPENGLELRDEYISILNYSSTRVWANSAAMMMPITYDQWSGVQFSDTTRMILHGVMHRHYKALWTGNPHEHATRPDIMKWCRSLGITTSEKTLREVINNGIAQLMLSEVPVGRGKIMGIAPTLKAVDMYQASCCLYAALFGVTWRVGQTENSLGEIIDDGSDGLFFDLAVISRAMVREFSAAGIDFSRVIRKLPRFTRC